MNAPACPICQGVAFGPFNNRPGARCLTCGSLERGRYQWLVYRKLVTLPQPAVVGHFAPERFLMEHFSSDPSIRYLAYDKFPDLYKHEKIHVIELDICERIEGMESNVFDLLIHSHVLEHLPCDVEMVLRQMKRTLKPGGVMLFSVPFQDDLTVEDLDPSLTPEQRRQRFSQHDHMRIFGRLDFPQLVQRTLGSDCLVRQKDHFESHELEHANIPIARKSEPNGRSVFLYRK
jgi:SAM-dependent methyltransferase